MPDPKLLVLGAGRHQQRLIRRAEERGIHTFALDPYEDAPGKQDARTSLLGDAFSVEVAMSAARQHGVDGIVTVGTDQTVAPAAEVADELQLPLGLSVAGAKAATNKQTMRQTLGDGGVAMARGVAVTGFHSSSVDKLNLPVIVKPADSQGQRGTSRVDSPEQLPGAIQAALDNSPRSIAIVEEFLVGPEVTINAWVHGSEAIVLGVTDRVTMNPPPRVGICLQHIYPSRHVSDGDEAQRIATDVARAFDVTDGPLYIQAIATDRGVIVVEAAARVGGGHEMTLLPATVGVELVDRAINVALGLPNDRPIPTQLSAGIVTFIVARPGTIQRCDPIAGEGIVEAAWYREPPFEQDAVVDSLGRIGYFVTTASTRHEAVRRASENYARLGAYDSSDTNLVYWPNADQILGG